MESKCNSPTFRYVSAGAGGRSLDIREYQKVECFNCRDDTAQIYNRSVFRKELIFCSECNPPTFTPFSRKFRGYQNPPTFTPFSRKFRGYQNSESENYGRKLWAYNMREELLKKLAEKEKDLQLCSNCFSNSNKQYNRTIYWCHYAFCSERCQYDFEYDLRKYR